MIADSMNQAKTQQDAIGADTLQDWASCGPPSPARRPALRRTRMADRHRPLFNVTISNVPGPPFPLYFAGARMVATCPIGPIAGRRRAQHDSLPLPRLDGLGLNACSDLIPDVGRSPAAHRRPRGLSKAAAQA
jgi:hypothetical protein